MSVGRSIPTFLFRKQENTYTAPAQPPQIVLDIQIYCGNISFSETTIVLTPLGAPPARGALGLTPNVASVTLRYVALLARRLGVI